jgi:hypothetical protein
MNHADYIDHCEDAYSYISDASKDATGCRFRFDYTQYTLIQLLMQGDSWTMRVIDAIEESKREEALAVAEFEATVSTTIEMGAGDRATAIRWIKDAWKHDESDDYFDASYFLYHHGLPYSYDIDKGEVNAKLSYLN